MFFSTPKGSRLKINLFEKKFKEELNQGYAALSKGEINNLKDGLTTMQKVQKACLSTRAIQKDADTSFTAIEAEVCFIIYLIGNVIITDISGMASMNEWVLKDFIWPYVEILNTTSYQTVPLSNSKIFLWAMFKA
jgi:hypothetical protein